MCDNGDREQNDKQRQWRKRVDLKKLLNMADEGG